jgi:hypothetical protein
MHSVAPLNLLAFKYTLDGRNRPVSGTVGNLLSYGVDSYPEQIIRVYERDWGSCVEFYVGNFFRTVIGCCFDPMSIDLFG